MLRASLIPLLQDLEEARLQGLNNLFGSMVAPSFKELLEVDNELNTVLNEIGEALVTGRELFLN